VADVAIAGKAGKGLKRDAAYAQTARIILRIFVLDLRRKMREGQKMQVYQARDGFVGSEVGSYTTREGADGVVLQQIGTGVVHIYRRSSVARKPATVIMLIEDEKCHSSSLKALSANI
jgi:hypothetical protein